MLYVQKIAELENEMNQVLITEKLDEERKNQSAVKFLIMKEIFMKPGTGLHMKTRIIYGITKHLRFPYVSSSSKKPFFLYDSTRYPSKFLHRQA